MGGPARVRTLLLLRHAKSSWRDPGQSDHERPLNGRGRDAADAMAARMLDQGLVPDLALVSTARRTQETWRRLCDAWGRTPEAKVLRSLYLAPPSRLLAALCRAPAEGRRLLLLGHNPGIEHLAEGLAGPGSDGAALSRLRTKYPTAGLAVFRCDLEDWSALAAERCRLTGFQTPRALRADD